MIRTDMSFWSTDWIYIGSNYELAVREREDFALVTLNLTFVIRNALSERGVDV
jgi:hypothetical protein